MKILIEPLSLMLNKAVEQVCNGSSETIYINKMYMYGPVINPV